MERLKGKCVRALHSTSFVVLCKAKSAGCILHDCWIVIGARDLTLTARLLPSFITRMYLAVQFYQSSSIQSNLIQSNLIQGTRLCAGNEDPSNQAALAGGSRSGA